MVLEALGQSPRVPQYMFQSTALAQTLQGCSARELQPAHEPSVIPSKSQVLEFGIHRESQL